MEKSPQLLSFNFAQRNADNYVSPSQTQEGIAPLKDGLRLNLRLETCVHDRLGSGSDEFGSLLVFSLEATSRNGQSRQIPDATAISIGFEREIKRDYDVFEILQTGQDGSLAVDIDQRTCRVSWSITATTSRFRFGVLIKRSFQDLFIGSFAVVVDEKLWESLQNSPDEEPVLFDPSAAPVGGLGDFENFETASSNSLSSLSASPPGFRHVSSYGTDNEAPSSHDDASQNEKSSKAKNLGIYHHKHRHVHQTRWENHGRASNNPHTALEMQPLHSERIEEDVWTHPVRYITSHEMGMNLFGLQITRSGVRCIRSVKIKLVRTNDSGEVQEYEASGHWSMFGMLFHKKQYHREAKEEGQDRYLVVGALSRNGYVTKEKIFRYREHDEDQMLQKLHQAIQTVRGTRGFFSLKKVSGFGLYQCDPVAGHHTRALLSETQRSLLRSFYNSYEWRSQGAAEFLWDDWIFKHLNNSSTNPTEGKYSIEVLLSWSVLRMSIVTSIPVILSLGVGFWYQTLPAEDGSDPTGTAWIIATYIITAGALIIAFPRSGYWP